MRDAKSDKVEEFINKECIMLGLMERPEQFVKFMCDTGAVAPMYQSKGDIDTGFIWPCGYGEFRCVFYRGKWRAKYNRSPLVASKQCWVCEKHKPENEMRREKNAHEVWVTLCDNCLAW